MMRTSGSGHQPESRPGAHLRKSRSAWACEADNRIKDAGHRSKQKALWSRQGGGFNPLISPKNSCSIPIGRPAGPKAGAGSPCEPVTIRRLRAPPGVDCREQNRRVPWRRRSPPEGLPLPEPPTPCGPTHGRVASTTVDAGKESVSVRRLGKNLPAGFASPGRAAAFSTGPEDDWCPLSEVRDPSQQHLWRTSESHGHQ
jgi:hypothetical protein